jgi:outer membrane protein OmpA-like peptidoglycan-associated protein
MRKLGLVLLSALVLSACATARNETRTYIVFFAYDTAALTPEARNIVVQAAANAKAVKAVRIDLGGYVGQGPTARTDGALTARRFATVEDTLAAQGVDRRLFARVPLMDEVQLPATAVRRIEIRLIAD